MDKNSELGCHLSFFKTEDSKIDLIFVIRLTALRMKDNNGFLLVFVDDRVQSDGSLICHRQHAHLPEHFQNWRLKDVTPEDERVFYQDGKLCDLPESPHLDVRLEMPQGSVWNEKQSELAAFLLIGECDCCNTDDCSRSYISACIYISDFKLYCR